MPSSVRSPRAAAASSVQPCEKSSSRRRSITSASAPAGNASKKIGMLVAAWISDTTSGDGDSVSLAMLSIQHEPTWDEASLSESGSEFRRCNDILLSIDVRQLWGGGWRVRHRQK